MSISPSSEREPIFVIRDSAYPFNENVMKVSLASVGTFFLVISGLAAAGLLLPHTSLGIGALIATSTVSGVAGIALLSAAGYLHRRRAQFAILNTESEDPVEKSVSVKIKNYEESEQNNKGFFYKIKDTEGKTRGYLFGTYHKPTEWKGINERIRSKLDKCFATCGEVDLTKLPYNKKLVPYPSDYTIFEYVKSQKICKKFNGFETGLQQALAVVGTRQLMHENPNELSEWDNDSVDQKFNEIWKAGHTQDFIDYYNETMPFKSAELNGQYNKILLGDRNEKWSNKLALDRFPADKKFFLYVGAAHLFDFPEATGLITLLQDKGWTVETAYPEAESSASQSASHLDLE